MDSPAKGDARQRPPRQVPIVVVGGSAGAMEALSVLCGSLPADLGAAVLVVMHLPSTGTSHLATILDRRGPLPAAVARDGDLPEPGRISVAAVDHHLLLCDGRVEVSRGPRENLHRPSIDVLFRSAAESGAQTVAVLLSGLRNDGVAGLIAVKDAGGTTIVQEPEDALFPALP